ncbi:hypothetical protein Thermo_01096 [Thermoplasmatales archaeon]|nr:hypothetical protein Thermo_01096 [Thermoplasmatales archaeon]
MSEPPSNKDHVTIRSVMDFRAPFLEEVLDWAVNNIFSKIWLSSEWNRCAKGGNDNKKFEKYRDMDYLAHIFSGTLMALKVLDYKYISEPVSDRQLQEEILSIKRSIFCFLFHDYNKITGVDYSMKDRSTLFELVDKYFRELRNELNLTNDEVYQVVFSTELGTTYNIIKNKNQRSGLFFESNFSRVADQLSSRFNREVSGNMKSIEDSIDWGSEPVVPGRFLKKILFGATSLYACEDVARKACLQVIELSGGFYLWSTNRAIFYVSDGDDSVIQTGLTKAFEDIVNKILQPENLLTFNDRSVINSASGIVAHTKDSIITYVKEDGFKKCIWMEDIEITPENRDAAYAYSDAVKTATITFSLNFKKINEKSRTSLRDGLEIYEIQDEEKGIEERLKVFMARYVQLKTDLNTQNAKELRSFLESTLEKYKDGILKGLLGKIERNSGLLIPFAIQTKEVDWDVLLSDILSDLNKEQKFVDFNDILSKIVVRNIDSLVLPRVPNKFKMSMVNAYPASEKATRENLFGINTQTFNNRLPTSGISNGKVDQISKFEFALRRNLVPRSGSEDEGLMFMSFPGAIPFIDMSDYMTHLAYSREEELSEVNNLKLSLRAINRFKREVRLDSTYFYSVKHLKTEEEILKNTYQALNIYRRTKMLIRLSFSNSPFFEDQYEAVRIEVGNSICTAMGWERIRCNQIEGVLDTITTFNVVVNGSISKIDFKETANVIGNYIQQPMSLFYHVHKLVFDKKDSKMTGFGKQFSEKIENIRKLAYEWDKDGGKKMKSITELAKSAAKMVRPTWNMSGNYRTWMLRDSLEAIEKAKVSLTAGEDRDLSEYKVFVEGVILKTLQRDKSRTWMPTDTDIAEFADKLIYLLKEDFDSRVPSGSMKSYLINAFEFEYMRSGKGDEK